MASMPKMSAASNASSGISYSGILFVIVLAARAELFVLHYLFLVDLITFVASLALI